MRVSRTWKDSREQKLEHWQSTYTPSLFNKLCRQSARNQARRDFQRGREPAPKYSVEKLWWW